MNLSIYSPAYLPAGKRSDRNIFKQMALLDWEWKNWVSPELNKAIALYNQNSRWHLQIKQFSAERDT